MSKHLFDLINCEQIRQEETINLIASENYVSRNILAASGSILTNKYAEGYPGNRYYGGCEIIDQIESYAIDLGKKLFETEHINVQPHSGSSANFSVFLATLNPGDTILGMSLNAGGHLTHGYKVNFSGKLYNVISYGVNQDTERINYDEVQMLAQKHVPKIIIAGASSYSRLIDYARFKEIAKSVNALLFVDMAHIAGLVAAQVIPSPIPFADITSSTTHKTLRGPRSGIICSTAALAKNIDKAVMPGSQGGPLMHIIAAKAIAFEEAATIEFKHYAQQIIINAAYMAQLFINRGYHIVSGGTDNHLFLVDLSNKNITGKAAEEVLQLCNIVVNRNAIPFDTQSPLITSGIRIGTPAITTRGFNKKEIEYIVDWIDNALINKNNASYLAAIKENVKKLCARLPIYH